MSEQPLDLRRALQIVWRRKLLAGVFTGLGLVAGVAYATHHPPTRASTALVILPPSTHDTRTQVVIASSDPVLASALRTAGRPRVSVPNLRERIEVSSPSYNVISITARDKTAAHAERTANAVATGYVNYVNSRSTPGRVGHAQVLSPATDATGQSLAVRLLSDVGLGGLAGLLAGAVLALAISHSGRRLRKRDEIAGSIGIPVLASMPVRHPHATAGWKELLAAYQPGVVDAWRLRRALRHLGLADEDGSALSLTVLSLSSDRKALAIGPQLAVFSASLGIPTALVIGPQQDANITATLRAACATSSASARLPKDLRVAVCDRDNAELPPAMLTVIVTVVDGKTPKVAGTIRTTAAVLGVSAGAATAEQLACVAASAAADGRHIAGIFVADPDSDDHTTGLLPQFTLPAQRRKPQMGMTGTATESRQ